MENTDPHVKWINKKSQIIVFIVSFLVGLIALFVDIWLDHLVLGKSSFIEYLYFQLKSGHYISRRSWFLFFPIFGLVIHYLIVSKQIEVFKYKSRMIDLISNSKEMIVFYNSKQILQVNNAFIEIMGFSPNNIPNISVDQFFPYVRKAEKLRKGEFTWISKEGKIINVDIVITGNLFQEEKMIIAENITDRKELIREKEELQNQINREERMELVGQLAGGIAHDFNNELSIISGNAELLKMFYSLNDKGNDMIDEIIKTCSRAAALTSQLLTISKDKVSEFRKINIHNLIEDAINIGHQTFPKIITIRREFLNQPVIVEVDEAHLLSAVLNIFINARDAMPNGGSLTVKTNKIKLSTYQLRKLGYQISEGDYLELKITDTGIGMNPNTLNKIFDPFFTTKKNGTGLGLSRVYSIIRSNGGWINATSEKGKGTTFTIYLPLVKNGKIESELVEDIKLLNGNYSCLIIEDEEAIREILTKYLRNEECKVSLSGDPIDAINYYTRNYEKIDLIFLDINMPVLDGWQIIDKMKSVNTDLSNVILMTGSINLDDRKLNIYSNEIIGVLRKPFNRKELIKIINSWEN